MTNSEQILQDLREAAERASVLPRPVVGIVFRVVLKGAVSQLFPQAQIPGGNPFSGVPVYFDEEQPQDCVIFEDGELLRAYLDRISNPRAWHIALAKTLRGAHNPLDGKCPIPPRIPNFNNEPTQN